ncbi:HAD family hydrolase [Candidatus Methylospira mobilis]|uniref:HAD family hydrolase n=1 Tax=Candidatus Methylospira mobilis TaxID=1808979 RepID=A0A5Q0BKQ4_9GAMM|nr:HAD family hydrolase [Candidatus Methylospira mobilis]QFY42697.1 HAD family hydrolase [Candidatus Methylospira mobilis]WNV04184.1 HAD family hydrolase [Candidatus Methylospira mobilis]
MSHSLQIKAALFDLDGTLHDRASSLAHFATEQHNRLKLAPFVCSNIWVNRFIKLDADGQVWKDKVYQVITSEINIPLSWQALLADYEKNFPLFARLYPGAVEMLSTLRERGFTLGMITNGRSAFQQSVIKTLGIAALFEVFLISEAEGVRKPEAEIFLRALKRLGVTQKEAIFVGDSPSADIAGAGNAGIYAVWKRNRPTLPAPDNCDHAIACLSELCALPQLDGKN